MCSWTPVFSLSQQPRFTEPRILSVTNTAQQKDLWYVCMGSLQVPPTDAGLGGVETLK